MKIEQLQKTNMHLLWNYISVSNEYSLREELGISVHQFENFITIYRWTNTIINIG
jgi:hypothetical protein